MKVDKTLLSITCDPVTVFMVIDVSDPFCYVLCDLEQKGALPLSTV